MQSTQRAVLYFGIINLAIGLAGLFGPFVTGNQDRLINIEVGRLFGLLAINWAHALLHLAFGIYGIAARRTMEAAVTYLWATVAVFGILALLGFLAQAGLFVRRSPEGTLLVLEVAVDTAANILHLAWVAVGLWFALRADRARAQQAPQPA